MRFVLRNIDNGKFVAPSGSHNSYTDRLQNAKTFATREAAEADACGNEVAAAVEDLMATPKDHN